MCYIPATLSDQFTPTLQEHVFTLQSRLSELSQTCIFLCLLLCWGLQS